jgi:hypothetical protein
MKFILFKTLNYQRSVLIYQIILIEIIILALITQFYIPESYFLSSIGGSAGIIEYNSKISRLVNSSLEIDNHISEKIDIQIETSGFETTLKPMGKLNRTNHILYPEDAASYIIPENEVVKWYAENTVLTDDALLWKQNRRPVKFKYETDDDLFNFPPDNDSWQNADYYLTHGCIGDCEDFSLAFASILEAKGISAEVIGVLLINDRYHWIVKYHYNGQINYGDINRNNVIIWHDSNPTVSKEWVSIDRNGIQKIS